MLTRMLLASCNVRFYAAVSQVSNDAFSHYVAIYISIKLVYCNINSNANGINSSVQQHHRCYALLRRCLYYCLYHHKLSGIVKLASFTLQER